MSDRELFAYYKRTALAGDLAFFLRGTLSDDLRASAMASEPTKANLSTLRCLWRAESNARDRAAGIPALGTEAWRDALLWADEQATLESTVFAA